MGKPKARGNGQGSAIKRGKYWEARVVIGWKPNSLGNKLLPIIKTKCGFKTKKEALAYCPTLKSSYGRPVASPTVEYYWKVYEKGEYSQLSKSKQESYLIAWNKMKNIWHREIASLSVGDLRSLVSEKTSTYYPARDIKQVLNHLFKLAGADRWVDKSLPSYIVLPQINEKERQPFTEEEQKSIWKTYEHGNKTAGLVLLMIYTGMMPGEIRKLKPEMIDLENRTITGAGIKTKVRKEATVFLATDIVPVVEDLINSKTIPCNWTKDAFYSAYYRALSEAGCRRLAPYSCRHTTATALAVSAAVAPQTVQKIMRWASTKMMDRYVHPDTTDIRDAVEAMYKKMN